MGAVGISEILDDSDTLNDFCNAMELKQLEKKRVLEYA